jgi:hypothetical protein
MGESVEVNFDQGREAYEAAALAQDQETVFACWRLARRHGFDRIEHKVAEGKKERKLTVTFIHDSYDAQTS